MEYIKKQNLQSKYNIKFKGITAMQIIVIVAFIALLLLLSIPILTRYMKVANRNTEYGLVNSIYRSSISAVANDNVNKTSRTALYNSENNIYKLDTTDPLVQDIISGIKANVEIKVYAYTTMQNSNFMLDNPSDSWLVFVKSNNGIIDISGTIYIVAPESMNCYSNGNLEVSLKQK